MRETLRDLNDPTALPVGGRRNVQIAQHPERFMHIDVSDRLDYLQSGTDDVFRCVPGMLPSGVSICLIAALLAFLIASTVLRIISGATSGTSS